MYDNNDNKLKVLYDSAFCNLTFTDLYLFAQIKMCNKKGN